MAGVPYHVDPIVIQRARAAAIARGGVPLPVVSANTPAPAATPVPQVIDDSGQVVQRGGKADVAPQSIVNKPTEILSELQTPPAPEEAGLTEADPSAYDVVEERPRLDNSGTNFFDKPGATDALTAFGAAMLKAPTFMQGLGDAALAVNQIERERRMPTEEEIARAGLKKRLADAQNGTGGMEWMSVETLVGEDGNQYTKKFNRRTGEIKYHNDSTGEDTDAVPGAIRIQNSGTGKDRELDAKAMDMDWAAANIATQNIENYERLKELVPTAGVGTDYYTKIMRGLASATGKDIGNVQIADFTEFQKYARSIELDKAMTQRGLGQFTETERQIVREALPNIDSNPEAAQKLLDVMIAREERIQHMMDDWEDSGLPIGEFRKFKRKWLREWEKTNGNIIGNSGGGASKSSAPSGEVDPSVSKYYQ